MTDTDRYADSFAIIDADGDGLISATELVALMRTLGDDVTDDAAAQAVELMTPTATAGYPCPSSPATSRPGGARRRADGPVLHSIRDSWVTAR